MGFMKKNSLIVYSNNLSVLIKIITNYMQISIIVTTFDFELPIAFIAISNNIGNPIE
jgi:hypothetical protein